MIRKGYLPLSKVLQEALDQAQSGKGSDRHSNGKPFLNQPIITDGTNLPDGLVFQARKKLLEAAKCPDDDRAISDLLGAIVYTAAYIIVRRIKKEPQPHVGCKCTKEESQEVEPEAFTRGPI